MQMTECTSQRKLPGAAPVVLETDYVTNYMTRNVYELAIYPAYLPKSEVTYLPALHTVPLYPNINP